VLTSVESPDRSYCVDFFERPTGGFGYEQFRSDPEDGGTWTPISGFAAKHFEGVDAAITDARLRVSWLLHALPTRGDGPRVAWRPHHHDATPTSAMVDRYTE
jgi:hypothetical protein